MVDFHSHFLPNFDDGAQSMEIALEMLRESKRQGVDTVVSTSHCRPHQLESIALFVEKRNRRIEKIKKETEKQPERYPKVLAGCELNLCADISKYDNLCEVCVENTNYLLLEMPYRQWHKWMIDTIHNLTLRGIHPVMAHIERFLDRPQSCLKDIFELDVIYQVNAEAFLDRRHRKAVRQLMENGRVQVLGSDMHNLTRRSQNLKYAREVILDEYGASCFSYLEENAEKILRNEPVKKLAWKKQASNLFFRKIFKSDRRKNSDFS